MRADQGGYRTGMTSSDRPRPYPSPEDEGIPDYADDTSTAFDESERPRFNDSPQQFPADRPQALDEYGLTAAEQRQGESLDRRLDREEPDTGEEWAAGGGHLTEEADPATSEEEVARDSAVLGTEPEPTADQAARRAASEYDDRSLPEYGDVGRLLEPDEGARPDQEKDVLARDEGEAGGGLSAEEAALHDLPDEDVPYER